MRTLFNKLDLIKLTQENLEKANLEISNLSPEFVLSDLDLSKAFGYAYKDLLETPESVAK